MKVPTAYEYICKKLFWEYFTPVLIFAQVQPISSLVAPPSTHAQVGDDIFIAVENNWFIRIAHVTHADWRMVNHLFHANLLLAHCGLLGFTPLRVEWFVLFNVVVDLQSVMY